MTEPSVFDSRPDPVLGARIRDALDGSDSEAFLARMREVVRWARAETAWDVLARWAPGGLVAAAVAAVVVWLMIRPAEPPTVEARIAASAPFSMELSPTQPEYEVLTTALLEGR